MQQKKWNFQKSKLPTTERRIFWYFRSYTIVNWATSTNYNKLFEWIIFMIKLYFVTQDFSLLVSLD